MIPEIERPREIPTDSIAAIIAVIGTATNTTGIERESRSGVLRGVYATPVDLEIARIRTGGGGMNATHQGIDQDLLTKADVEISVLQIKAQDATQGWLDDARQHVSNALSRIN